MRRVTLLCSPADNIEEVRLRQLLLQLWLTDTVVGGAGGDTGGLDQRAGRAGGVYCAQEEWLGHSKGAGALPVPLLTQCHVTAWRFIQVWFANGNISGQFSKMPAFEGDFPLHQHMNPPLIPVFPRRRRRR